MKITKRQLRRIIRESLVNREEIIDLIYAVLEAWDSKGGIDGVALVSEVQRLVDFDVALDSHAGVGRLTKDDIFSTLDEMLEDGKVHFDAEEEVWSLAPRVQSI